MHLTNLNDVFKELFVQAERTKELPELRKVDVKNQHDDEAVRSAMKIRVTLRDNCPFHGQQACGDIRNSCAYSQA